MNNGIYTNIYKKKISFVGFALLIESEMEKRKEENTCLGWVKFCFTNASNI